MDRDTFVTVAEKYLHDVLVEATKLFDDGVAHDRCVPIALGIVDGKDMKKSRELQGLVMPGNAATVRIRN
jgi:hypothetical protein